LPLYFSHVLSKVIKHLLVLGNYSVFLTLCLSQLSLLVINYSLKPFIFISNLFSLVLAVAKLVLKVFDPTLHFSSSRQQLRFKTSLRPFYFLLSLGFYFVNRTQKLFLLQRNSFSFELQNFELFPVLSP